MATAAAAGSNILICRYKIKGCYVHWFKLWPQVRKIHPSKLRGHWEQTSRILDSNPQGLISSLVYFCRTFDLRSWEFDLPKTDKKRDHNAKIINCFSWNFRYADKLKSENTAGDIVPFNHPFLQACGMFLGEMLCMVAFYVVKWYKKKRREQRAAISSGIEG